VLPAAFADGTGLADRGARRRSRRAVINRTPATNATLSRTDRATTGLRQQGTSCADDAHVKDSALIPPGDLAANAATPRRPSITATADAYIRARNQLITAGTPHRFGGWLSRPRRVLLALTAVWVVAVFDFGFTLYEWGSADFIELNPVAAQILSGPPYAITIYKFGLLGIGTAILLLLRRHSVAELASWFLVAMKVYLAARWLDYYDVLLGQSGDPLARF
jgi:hypothetical protein